MCVCTAYEIKRERLKVLDGGTKNADRVLMFQVKAVLFIPQNSKGKSQSREVRGFVFCVSVCICMCV